jgi:hypothetical protein
MKLLAFLSCALVAASMSAGAAPDLRAIIAHQDDVLQTATREYDTGTIDRLQTPDFTLVTTSGRVLNAKDVLADIGDRSVQWIENTPEDVHVRGYNDDCAIVVATLHQEYRYRGKLFDYRVRFTDTWVKLGGRWRYAAGHASMLKH